MAKVFSWKLNDKENAYLFIPNKKTHVSERIVDADIINKMIDIISLWDEKRYKKAFDEMNVELSELYNFEVPYDSKYFTGNSEKNNIVILGSSTDKKQDIEEFKKEVLNEIDERFDKILKEFNNLYNELLNKINKKVIDSIQSSKEIQKETLTKLNTIKNDVEKRFELASNKFEKASKVLELDNEDINAETLKDLYKKVNKTSKWVGCVSGDITTFAQEYSEFGKNFTQEEVKDGVFKAFKNKIENTDIAISGIQKENETLKTNLKILENEQRVQRENIAKQERLLLSKTT